VLDAFAQGKPSRLFVFGDGPRPDRRDDKRKCAAARAVVRGLVDWNCKLIETYSDESLGCGKRLAGEAMVQWKRSPSG